MGEIDTSAARVAEIVDLLTVPLAGYRLETKNAYMIAEWINALAAERDALAKQLIAVNAVVATFARPDVSAVQRGEAVAVWRDLTPDMLADYPVRLEADDPAQRLAATAAIHTELVKACRVKA